MTGIKLTAERLRTVSHGCFREAEQPAPRGRGADFVRALSRLAAVVCYTGKKTPGEPGHTRDTRAHTGTRITQTNLTTIQTHQYTRTSARPHSTGTGWPGVSDWCVGL